MKIPKLKLNFKSNKKLFMGIGFVIIIIILAIVFGHSKNSGSDSTSNLPTFPVTSSENINILKSKVNKSLTYDIVGSDPDKYKGQVVQWGGRVFVDPEKDDKAIYLQIMQTDSDKAFVVGYKKPDFQVKIDDYIMVTGVVKGKFEGENGFGAKISNPLIEAGIIEQSTRSETAEKADVSIPVNQPNSQNGFTVTLEKVEIAGSETRFFLKVKNDSQQKVSFYTYDAKVMQGSKQLEAKSSWNSQEEIPSEILPGAEVSGVLVSDTLDKSQKEASLFLPKPYGSNYRDNWEDITFKISIP